MKRLDKFSFTNQQPICKFLRFSALQQKYILSHQILDGSFRNNSLKIHSSNSLCMQEKLVAKVFKHMVVIMYNFSKRFLYWFSREEVDMTMPASFRKHFPKTRVIIDATEIRHGHLYIWIKDQKSKKNIWNYLFQLNLHFLCFI